MRPLLLLAATTLLAQAPDAVKPAILDRIDSQAAKFGQMSRQIWEWAEVGYQETRSSGLLRDELKAAGFRIVENVGGAPTAFTATWGSGKPVIGILGEFDALPGLSQEDEPVKKVRAAGAAGHGCGHNLFGVASALAAITVKEQMMKLGIQGTVRFYGTPAEEGGGGKIYMIRAGAFNDVDAVLDWHPASSNQVRAGTSLANISAKFRFHGRSSHAAASPEQGRSALDALMLMNHAVELLREHIPQETRIHYIVTRGGGAPNVVPDFAEGYFYARHSNMLVLDGVWDRLVKCAQAGALATETRMEMELVNAVYNVLPNGPLNSVIEKNLKQVGGVKYTPEETAWAEKLRASLTDPPPLGSQETLQTGRVGLGGSTDSADVSWAVPTGAFSAATFVPGSPGHSWQNVACAGSSIGRKGMIVAAKTLALSAMDLLYDPASLRAARADFDKRRAGHQYKSRIPAGQKPPLRYRETGE
ncbi:MAG: amidohydrolase [Acidobacteria bacterium]|nr:amidohydrolase [Acidobacteriota bacterium]